MNRASTLTLACSAGWLAVTLAYFAFYYDKLLSLFTPLLGGALFLAAIPLAVTAAVLGFKGKRRVMVLAGALVATAAILGWFTPAGKSFGAHCKFRLEKPEYETIVAELAAGAADSAFEHPITVDPGPPRRLAISWGGTLDNWIGVVHDPTGEVLKANILDTETWSNRNDSDYASVAGLFGGTLIRARHLEGHWYLCWFT